MDLPVTAPENISAKSVQFIVQNPCLLKVQTSSDRTNKVKIENFMLHKLGKLF